MVKLIQTLSGLKTYLGFITTFISILAIWSLGFYKDQEVSGYIVALLVTYTTGRTAGQISAHRAASTDETCDTKSVVEIVDKE